MTRFSIGRKTEINDIEVKVITTILLACVSSMALLSCGKIQPAEIPQPRQEEEKQEEGGTPGAIRVVDLNSRNGTFVNGRRLLPNEAAILIPGDECRFGSEEFVYR